MLIAGNPYSGRGGSAGKVARLTEALAAQGLRPHVVWDREERKAVFAHPELGRHCRCVVAAGGDGTLGDVINAAPDMPVAVLPLGTENLLAKHYGFTAGPDEVARAIARGQVRRIDVGQVWTADAPEGAVYPGAAGVKARKFTLMFSAGIDARVAHRLARWRAAGGAMRTIRHSSYFRPIFDTLRDYEYPAVDLLTREGARASGTNAMIFNLPCYGFNLGFGRGACEDDGELHWRVFAGRGMMPTLSFVLASVLGRQLRRRDTTHGQSASIEITSAVPVPIQIDGDPAGYTPARLEVLPKSLSVIAVK